MKSLIGLAAIAALTSVADANIQITEILGQSSGPDLEFIEIANTGNAPVDITGWSIELWDSDQGISFGGSDGASAYFVEGAATLAPGETYVWANQLAIDAFTGGTLDGAEYATDYLGLPFTTDALLPNNSVENSSYTAILVDAAGEPADSWFISDGDDGDAPNRAGDTITPNIVAGPDGSFLPAGYTRFDTDLDGSLDFADVLEFTRPDFGSPALGQQDELRGATPGVWQAPTPGAAGLLGLAGLAAARRRR